MSKFQDLSGEKFSRITVIRRVENKTTSGGGRKTMYLCKCDCGMIKEIDAQSLKSGRTKSCGCYGVESSRKRFTTHGMRHTKGYSTWAGIKNRCFNKNTCRYERYGGRGITMCNEWKNDFLSFYQYVSNLPHAFEDGYSIDRINNDGNYEPNNIRWATRKEQARNQGNCVFYEFNGTKIHIKDLAELVGTPYGTLKSRHQKNIPILNEKEKEILLHGIKNRELSASEQN